MFSFNLFNMNQANKVSLVRGVSLRYIPHSSNLHEKDIHLKLLIIFIDTYVYLSGTFSAPLTPCLVFLFCGTKDPTQDLMHSRQLLYA
jgi:hypothetical protein